MPNDSLDSTGESQKMICTCYMVFCLYRQIVADLVEHNRQSEVCFSCLSPDNFEGRFHNPFSYNHSLVF